jgi:hypothetical protein
MLMLAALLAGCSGPPQPPHPAGEVVDVGGWQAAQTWMVNYAMEIEPGTTQASGWRVSIKHVGSRDLGATGSVYCVLLELQNTSAAPGALDLVANSPVLTDPQGVRYTVKAMRLGSDSFVLPDRQSGSMSSATQCSFTSPDAEGRQRADCESMLSAKSNGTTFDQALVAIGPGKSIDLELAFDALEDVSGLVLEWPDGTRFALP